MKVKAFVITSLIVAGAGYYFYDRLLSDDAKAEINNLAHSINEGYARVSEVIDSMTGQVVEDPSVLPNVQVTKAQWERLGY